MWLIARRSFTEGWLRLAATMLAALFSIGLIAGSLQFTLRAQEAVSGSDASEYARADVLVQGGSVDPDDPYAVPDGRVALARVAGGDFLHRRGGAVGGIVIDENGFPGDAGQRGIQPPHQFGDIAPFLEGGHDDGKLEQVGPGKTEIGPLW